MMMRVNDEPGSSSSGGYVKKKKKCRGARTWR
jgi:hypothetical protein